METSAQVILETKNYLALDIETNCILGCESHAQCQDAGHALRPQTSAISCIGLYAQGVRKVLRGDHDKLRRLLREEIVNWPGGIVGQNFAFDLRHISAQLGEDLASMIRERWVADTQLLAHICPEKIPQDWLDDYAEQRKLLNKDLPPGYSHREGKWLSLKTNAPYWLGVPAFWEDPCNHDSDEYVLKDCEYTYRLVALFFQKLQEHDAVDFLLERAMPWARFLNKCEATGVPVDLSLLASIEAEQSTRRDMILRELLTIWEEEIQNIQNKKELAVKAEYAEMTSLALSRMKAPTPEKEQKVKERYAKLLTKALTKSEPFNFASPSQVLALLRDELQLDVLDFSGKESTGVEVLERLTKSGNKDVGVLLEYREAEKLLTGFIPTYKELALNSRLFPSLNVTGTRTGRLSCSSPNLQQVPPSLYPIFRAPRGKKFLIYDLEAIEGKLIALYTQDPNLYHIILNNESIHDHNAILFFGLDCQPAEVKKKYPRERDAAKQVGFALCYGAGANRLVNTFTSHGFPVTQRQAKEMVTRFHERYEDIKSFHREITSTFEQGGILKNLYGRPICIQDPQDAYMQGFNTLIQSTASDMNLNIAYRAQEAAREAKLHAQVVLLVHDMIMIEVDEKDVDKMEEILLNEYTRIKLEGPLGPIKITASGGVFDVWKK